MVGKAGLGSYCSIVTEFFVLGNRKVLVIYSGDVYITL